MSHHGATNQRAYEDIEMAREDARLAEADAVRDLMDAEGLTEDAAWARLAQLRDLADE